MKSVITIVALLLGSLATAAAQDFYLPVSSTAKTAIASLHRAADLYANVHFKAGKAELDKAVADDPTFFMAYAYAAQYESKADRPALIDKAVSLDTTKLNKAEKIMRQLLVSWKADPKTKTAEAMKALVAAYPKTPQAWELASLLSAERDGNLDDGLIYAQKLAQLRPEYAPNYNTLGYIHLKKMEMDKSKIAFEQYIRLAPNEPNAYDSMGEFYTEAKDYAKSADYYDKAAAMGLPDAKERADKARAMIK